MGDARVGRFRKHFPVYVYQNVGACLKERQGVGATILLCCAIDTLAGYALLGANGSGNKAQYVAFLKKYFPSDYDSEIFYKFVRCGLVHSFDMEKKFAVLCVSDPWAQALHMKRAAKIRRTIINPYALFRHLKEAHQQFCDDLDADRTLRQEFVPIYRGSPIRPQHYRKEQVLEWMGTDPKKEPDQSPAPTSELAPGCGSS
tara:strand:+ start:842 stop:1444 length:603 start_codon:yes stop_codon:yes gene_type:complete